MAVLSSIKARGLRQLGRLDVALGGSSLVVIGPSGSGKSTLLQEIAKELRDDLGGRQHPGVAIELAGGTDRDLRIAYLGRPARLEWEGDPVAAFRSGHLIAATLDDERTGKALEGALDSEPKAPTARVFGQLERLLIDRWVQRGSTDAIGAQVIDAWLVDVQHALRTILGWGALRLAIQPESCTLDIGDGRRPRFDELAAGHRAALSLFAETFLRVEAARLRTETVDLEPRGVVVVDGFERSLDARLQRELLPTLARRFSGVQWIVSTHSPLVALSLEDAILLDVGRDVQRRCAAVRAEGLERLVAHMLGPAPAPRSQRPPPPKTPPPPPSRLPGAGRNKPHGPDR